MENIIKDIIAPFKSEELSISIDKNLLQIDFVDVWFNLSSDKRFPYRKPNNTHLFIHSESHHQPSITIKIVIQLK